MRQFLPKVDILLAGDTEMEIIIGEKEPQKIFNALEQYNISFIAVKQGEKGSVGYQHGIIAESPAILGNHW